VMAAIDCGLGRTFVTFSDMRNPQPVHERRLPRLTRIPESVLKPFTSDLDHPDTYAVSLSEHEGFYRTNRWSRLSPPRRRAKLARSVVRLTRGLCGSRNRIEPHTKVPWYGSLVPFIAAFRHVMVLM
jgi:hypothetical protein